MKKKLLLLGALVLSMGLLFKISTAESKVDQIKKQHAEFLKAHPFNQSMLLPKKQRLEAGLPPNKYNEQEYLNTISPYTGKTNEENIFKVQQELIDKKLSGRVPGDASDNAWEERGPNNVAGRVRAAMFDPNDATNETVFAGGVSGGLWKNTNISNANSKWTQIDIPDNLGISSITVDPNNSMTFYLGTGESYVGHTTGSATGNGVWKSTDGGTTWARIFGGNTGTSFFQSASNITINSPASISGDYASIPTTNFGPTISSAITNEFVLVDDGSGSPTEGCNALTNGAQLNGKIALIRRANCGFVDKVKNAQNAGAIAAIVMNNIDGDPIPMGGTDATITIPAVMITKADGDIIEAALSNGTVNGTLNPASGNFTAVVVPGAQHINDVKIKNNGGTSEIYVAVSDARYGASNATTFVGSLTYGLYKSVDGGANWTKVNLPKTSGGNDYVPNDIEVGSDGKIWVATTRSSTFNDGGGIIFSSTDGVTFTQSYAVPNGGRTQIAISSSNAGKLYVLAQLTSGGSVTILKTTTGFLAVTPGALPNDSDTNISSTDFTRGQSFYDLLLEVDPSNDENVFVGGIDLFRSTNGGAAWTQFSHWYGGFGFQEVHADQHIAAFAPGDSNKMIFGNDGGIYYTENAGSTTNARNNGLNITQFYGLGVAPTTAVSGDYFAAGAQDNGTQSFEDASSGIDSSVERYGGDGAYTFFDQDGTDAYFIRNYVYNNGINLYNVKNGSSFEINRENPQTGNGSFINEEALDSNLDILYTNYSASGNSIVRRYSTLKSPTGATKTNLTDALLTSSPRAFKVSPYTTSSSLLLVGTVLGDLLKVENANTGSPTWTEISGPSFVGSISDIEFGTNENEIFVTMHNYSVVSIWYTSDGGTTWANKEGDFPDIPVKTILQNPLNTDEVIIGTELGVWKTSNFKDATPNWTHSFNGMSNVKVLDLNLRNDNKVFAATHGRGIFSGDFTAASASVEEVLSGKNQFTVYPTTNNGSFTVFAKNTLGKSTITIHNIRGQKVYSSQLDFNSNEKQNISANGLKAGVYLVNLVGENNKKESRKIIVK